VSHPLPEKILSFPDLPRRELPSPLEGGVGLGDEGGQAHRDLPPETALPKDLEGQIGNSLQVFPGFRGKAHHEIQFQGPPARVEYRRCRFQQVLFPVSLVDHLPESPGPRFRSQGKARFSDPADFLYQPVCQGFHPQRRQGQGDFFPDAAVHEGAHEIADGGVIP